MKNKFIFSFKSVVIFVFSFVLLGSLVLSLSLPKKVSGDVSEPVGGWPEETPAETPAETPEEPSENYPASEYGYYYEIISDSNGTTSFLNPVPKEDAMAEVPTDLKIGEKWTGPSGQTYIATAPASTEPGSEQINAKLDTTLVPVSTGGTTDGGDNKYYYCNVCSGPKCVSNTFSSPCSSLCSTDANCITPSTPTPTPYSQSQYRCRQCRCQ